MGQLFRLLIRFDPEFLPQELAQRFELSHGLICQTLASEQTHRLSVGILAIGIQSDQTHSNCMGLGKLTLPFQDRGQIGQCSYRQMVQVFTLEQEPFLETRRVPYAQTAQQLALVEICCLGQVAQTGRTRVKCFVLMGRHGGQPGLKCQGVTHDSIPVELHA